MIAHLYLFVSAFTRKGTKKTPQRNIEGIDIFINVLDVQAKFCFIKNAQRINVAL